MSTEFLIPRWEQLKTDERNVWYKSLIIGPILANFVQWSKHLLQFCPTQQYIKIVTTMSSHRRVLAAMISSWSDNVIRFQSLQFFVSFSCVSRVFKSFPWMFFECCKAVSSGFQWFQRMSYKLYKRLSTIFQVYFKVNSKAFEVVAFGRGCLRVTQELISCVFWGCYQNVPKEL